MSRYVDMERTPPHLCSAGETTTHSTPSPIQWPSGPRQGQRHHRHPCQCGSPRTPTIVRETVTAPAAAPRHTPSPVNGDGGGDGAGGGLHTSPFLLSFPGESVCFSGSRSNGRRPVDMSPSRERFLAAAAQAPLFRSPMSSSSSSPPPSVPLRRRQQQETTERRDAGTRAETGEKTALAVSPLPRRTLQATAHSGASRSPHFPLPAFLFQQGAIEHSPGRQFGTSPVRGVGRNGEAVHTRERADGLALSGSRSATRPSPSLSGHGERCVERRVEEQKATGHHFGIFFGNSPKAAAKGREARSCGGGDDALNRGSAGIRDALVKGDGSSPLPAESVTRVGGVRVVRYAYGDSPYLQRLTQSATRQNELSASSQERRRAGIASLVCLQGGLFAQRERESRSATEETEATDRLNMCMQQASRGRHSPSRSLFPTDTAAVPAAAAAVPNEMTSAAEHPALSSTVSSYTSAPSLTLSASSLRRSVRGEANHGGCDQEKGRRTFLADITPEGEGTQKADRKKRVAEHTEEPRPNDPFSAECDNTDALSSCPARRSSSALGDRSEVHVSDNSDSKSTDKQAANERERPASRKRESSKTPAEHYLSGETLRRLSEEEEDCRYLLTGECPPVDVFCRWANRFFSEKGATTGRDRRGNGEPIKAATSPLSAKRSALSTSAAAASAGASKEDSHDGRSVSSTTSSAQSRHTGERNQPPPHGNTGENQPHSAMSPSSNTTSYRHNARRDSTDSVSPSQSTSSYFRERYSARQRSERGSLLLVVVEEENADADGSNRPPSAAPTAYAYSDDDDDDDDDGGGDTTSAAAALAASTTSAGHTRGDGGMVAGANGAYFTIPNFFSGETTPTTTTTTTVASGRNHFDADDEDAVTVDVAASGLRGRRPTDDVRHGLASLPGITAPTDVAPNADNHTEAASHMGSVEVPTPETYVPPPGSERDVRLFLYDAFGKGLVSIAETEG